MSSALIGWFAPWCALAFTAAEPWVGGDAVCAQALGRRLGQGNSPRAQGENNSCKDLTFAATEPRAGADAIPTKAKW